MPVVESFLLSSPPEKMISSEALEGVPLLLLANKQDVPVGYEIFVSAAHFITQITRNEPNGDPGEIHQTKERLSNALVLLHTAALRLPQKSERAAGSGVTPELTVLQLGPPRKDACCPLPF